MSDHGTPSGTFVNFIAAVVKALPRDLADADMRYWDKQGGAELAKRLRAALTRETSDESTASAAEDAPATPTYPDIGEEVEITFDFSTVTPLGMVRADGYDDHAQWKHTGETLTGEQTFVVKLVNGGYQPDWDALVTALKEHGDLPNGMLREAWKATFPQHDGKGPVGFADASFVRPRGSRHFPCVDSDGSSLFDWTDRGFYDDLRFVVVVRT